MALFQTRDNLLVGTFPRNVRAFMARRTRRGRVPAERVRTFLAAAIAVAALVCATLSMHVSRNMLNSDNA